MSSPTRNGNRSQQVGTESWIPTRIPSGWSVERLRRTVASSVNGIWGDEPVGDENDIACVRVADFDRVRGTVDLADPTIRNIPRSQRQNRLLAPGDLLIEKSGGGELQPVGAVVLFDSEIPAVSSNFVARMRVQRPHVARFLKFLHMSLWTGRVNLRSIKQTTGIQNLDFGSYMDERVLLPPPDVQRAIADFLDRKTAAIDALIEKKERLLELMAERRAALIHRAVTRGLHGSVPMHDSDIPWIGVTPAHWQIHQLNRVVARFIDYRGRTPQKDPNGKIPLITAGAIREGVIDHSRAPEWVSEEVQKELMSRGWPQVGDLLFTSEAPLGEVGLVEDSNIALAQRIILFRVNRERIRPEFLLLHFLSASGTGELYSRSSGSTAEGIRADRLRMSLVPTPPPAEQDEIVTHVLKRLGDYRAIANRIQSQLARLREYRQALITAAVTGQIDVTNHERVEVPT